MLPKNEKSLDNEYKKCKRQRNFISVSKESYNDYVEEAYSDIISAEKELREEINIKWAVVKAYQALFSMCTAIVIKNLGFYSKDHGCLIIILLKENLISDKTLKRVSSTLKNKESLFEEVTKIRLLRNKAMYFPKAQQKVNLAIVEEALKEIKEIIKALSEEI